MSFPTFPTTVTFTGSLGAGMTATIKERLGSVNGARVTYNPGTLYPEWEDEQMYRVAGVPTAYDAQLALVAAGCGYNSDHPDIPGISGFAMKSKDATKEGFIMVVSYKRPPQGSWPTGTALPMTLGVSFTAMEIPAETDTYGNVVVNSAGDPFNPPQNLTMFLVRFRIIRWMSAYTLATVRPLIGKVNHATLTLVTLGAIPARCVKLLNWAPAQDLMLNNSGAVLATLFPVLFELEYKGSDPVDGSAGGYDRKIIDKGYQAWFQGGSTGAIISKGKIYTKSNLQPVAEPVLLDGHGKPLLGDPYTVVDLKNPFTAWADNTQLPGWHGAAPTTFDGKDAVGTQYGGAADYLAPTTSRAGTFYLPYRIEREKDLGALATAGI